MNEINFMKMVTDLMEEDTQCNVDVMEKTFASKSCFLQMI